jgi:hypothetical protein
VFVAHITSKQKVVNDAYLLGSSCRASRQLLAASQLHRNQHSHGEWQCTRKLASAPSMEIDKMKHHFAVPANNG